MATGVGSVFARVYVQDVYPARLVAFCDAHKLRVVPEASKDRSAGQNTARTASFQHHCAVSLYKIIHTHTLHIYVQKHVHTFKLYSAWFTHMDPDNTCNCCKQLAWLVDAHFWLRCVIWFFFSLISSFVLSGDMFTLCSQYVKGRTTSLSSCHLSQFTTALTFLFSPPSLT